MLLPWQSKVTASPLHSLLILKTIQPDISDPKKSLTTVIGFGRHSRKNIIIAFSINNDPLRCPVLSFGKRH